MRVADFFRACAVLALLSFGVRPAVAQPQDVEEVTEDAKARELFQAASLQFDEGDYPLALQLFERAYKKSGRAPLLYNIALTAERLGRLQRAIEAYRAYISALPEGELARESRTRIRSLTAMQENLSPTRAAGSEQGEDDVPAIDISNDPDKTEASDGEASGPTPSPHDDPPAATPAQWYRQWWVWTVAGSVLAGGLTAALLVGPLSGGASEPPLDASAGKLVMTLRIQR